MATSVPRPTFGPKGFEAPLESAVLTGAQSDINAAFGNVLNMSPATPQGQMAAALASIIGNVDDLFLLFSALVDPAQSFGRMQDGIARIYFIERQPAKSTVVACLVTGQQGVTIPIGATAEGEDGLLYTSIETGTFDASGQMTLDFACTTTGAIVCITGNVDRIYTMIPGWDAITNPTAGIVGAPEENAAQFEQRRALSVAKNSNGWLAAVLGAVFAVPGVIDVFATENDTGITVNRGGAALVPNSIYVAVIGGDDLAVAEAIWTRKMPGCLYNGNTTVTVEDHNPVYSVPPQYLVRFERPTNVPYVVKVTAKNTDLVPSDALARVQKAIVDAWAGNDGGPRVRIGATVLASRFYAGVNAAWPGLQLVSILIGAGNDPVVKFQGFINQDSNTLTVYAVISGVVAPGQFVIDDEGGTAAGTIIRSQTTGTPGGVGTYLVSGYPQTVGLIIMYGVLPTEFEVDAHINQAPTIDPANVQLELV